jgi:hypothetical protein
VSTCPICGRRERGVCDECADLVRGLCGLCGRATACGAEYAAAWVRLGRAPSYPPCRVAASAAPPSWLVRAQRDAYGVGAAVCGPAARYVAATEPPEDRESVRGSIMAIARRWGARVRDWRERVSA